MTDKKEKLEPPSVLAFESKLACSDALMSAGAWESRSSPSAWNPVHITEKSVRGTASHRRKDVTKASKINLELKNPNLQRVDNAALPRGTDTLKVQFTLRVLGGLSTPFTCDNPAYQKKLADIIDKYIAKNSFTELARRYATNLANGRFLWRNRFGAERVEVRIQHQDKRWDFNALDLPLKDFGYHNDDLTAVAQVIESGLKGAQSTLLTVKAFSRLGELQTVFPSQELVMEDGKSGEKKSKYLYQLYDQAAMHSQKIGNALRTIDTWYPEFNAELGPIAIEPYGSVTHRGEVYRKHKENDFYTILDRWVGGEEPNAKDQHYVVAVLIRGGIFGKSAKEKS